MHACFFGNERNLDAFDGPAAQAVELWPIDWPDGRAPNPADRDATRDRNLWLRVVYEMLYEKPGLSRLIGVKTNIDPQDRENFDPVGLLGIHAGNAIERFQGWRNADRAGKAMPPYVYVRPVYNVFKTSFETIKYLIDFPGEFYPQALRLGFDEAAPSTDVDLIGANPTFTPKDQRNQRCYDLAWGGKPYEAIKLQITYEFDTELHLGDVSSVRKAATSHATKFGLPPVPPPKGNRKMA
jgi:hypothetical protein